MAKETRLITAALPYVNNVPHLGNIVGSHLPADIFARYCRLIGHKAILIGGTDENGTPTELAATRYNISPKELCDHFYKIHKKIYDWFNISYDNFSRTSNKIHHKTSQEFFINIYKKGFITPKKIQLPYCLSCNRQLSDRYIEGICPHCNYEKARGDQCEKCSTLLDPIDLKSPYCAICGSHSIEFRDVEHLFLDLKRLEPKLKAWIIKNKHWKKQVTAMALGWINKGLSPRSITRELKWGIKVPLKGYENLILYVWFEAPIGYISSTKEKFKDWKKYWTNKNAKIYHFIGKDNIPFHTIFWPGTIMAHGSYNLPFNVVGLQYLNYERGKFSKSKGWGVFCENLPDAGLDSDYWRFYLSSLIPETKDSEFLWNDFQARINNELIGNFGNFINRTLKFIALNFKNNVPRVQRIKNKQFISNINNQIKTILRMYETVELRQALLEILRLSDMGNKYFEKNEPWKTKDKEVLHVSANLCKILALLIQPFLPASSAKILSMLNCREQDWKKLAQFTVNGRIKKPEPLFNKLEDEQLKELKTKTSKVTEYFQPREDKNMVSFEEWKKLDIRIGMIKEAKDHPDAQKLVILKVIVGNEEKQLVAGLRGHYKNEELKGRKVVVLNNLQPATLRGVESQGMVLAAVDKDNVILLEPDKDIKEGSKVE